MKNESYKRALKIIPLAIIITILYTVDAPAQVSFTQVTYPTNGTSRSIAIGDLNGDGHPDLATGNFNDNNVSILMNDGTGAFEPPTQYPVGDRAGSIAIGDLDNDGSLDLVVVNELGGNLSVLINNGDGTFAAHSTYDVDDLPLWVAIGDLNGDGHPDLVSANIYGSNVSVLLNNGDGTFAAQSTYPVDGGISLALGDLNGDGHADLAVANGGGGNVSVLLNNGDGTFAAQSTYPVGSYASSIAIKDVDANGSLDLAVTNRNSDDLSILLNNGNGTFAAQSTYDVGDNPVSVAAGDLNGDNSPDLAVANTNSNNISILLNNGDGTFTAQSAHNLGSTPTSVAIGDLNGDGGSDLATANPTNSENVSVLLNTGPTKIPGAGNVLYVATGGTDTGDCTVEADPCATISYALNQVTPGDTINIADGLYTESDGLAIDKSLSLHGESESGTIIQAAEQPDQATSRVIAITGDHEVEISNLTIRHGMATTTDLGGQGGGIRNDGATLTLTNVTLSENRALYGGGMLTHSGATLTNVTFNENRAGAYGAGMFDNGGSAILSNVIFSGNTASSAGGGMYIQGGSPTLTNVVFSGNEAGASYGGGIYNGASSLTLINVTLSDNSAGLFGGGIYNASRNPSVLINTIVWGNRAEDTQGETPGNEIYIQVGSAVEIYYSLYGNSIGDISGPGAFTADNSLTDAPLFADPENGDYRLKGPGAAGGPSPAIDAGTPDTTGLGLPSADLAGEPRVTAVLGTEAVIDMGAYESTGAPLPVELAAFKASVEGRVVVLTWQTLSEKGNDGFAVERRKGRKAGKWKKVAFIEGRGMPSGGHAYEYRVEGLDYGTYTFRLRQEDLDGTTEVVGEVEAMVALAEPYVISKVYPNPSAGRTTLGVAVREAQRVRVEVYDVLGRRVATVFDEEVSANDTRRVRLDPDVSGLSSGVYFVRVVGEEFSATRRVVIVR